MALQHLINQVISDPENEAGLKDLGIFEEYSTGKFSEYVREFKSNAGWSALILDLEGGPEDLRVSRVTTDLPNKKSLRKNNIHPS